MRELFTVADLGASKILAAVSTAQGEILAKKRLPTMPERSPGEVIDDISHNLEEIKKQVGRFGDRWLGTAAATPGPFSHPEGLVEDSPNLGWKRVHLARELGNRLGGEVLVEKDTNMAVLGEYYFGQNRKYLHIIYITVSTGIGGGLLLDGQLYRGAGGGAGEIGHIMMEPDGPLCGCGRKGCLEAVASGQAMARIAEQLRSASWGSQYGFPEGPWGAVEIGQAARQGDSQAIKLVSRVRNYLGDAIANLVNTFNPQLVVLGGSMALGWKDILKPGLKEYICKRVFPLNARFFNLEFTHLGDDVVLLGCVAALLHNRSAAQPQA